MKLCEALLTLLEPVVSFDEFYEARWLVLLYGDWWFVEKYLDNDRLVV